MRIMVVSDYFQAKIGYAKIKVAQSLQAQGHRLIVVTSDRYFPFHNYQNTMMPLLGPRIKGTGFFIEEDITVIRNKTYFETLTRCAYAKIKHYLQLYKPDLVIVFGITTFSAITASYFKKIFGYKLVLADSHLPSELEQGNQLFKNFFYSLFRTFFSNIISNSADKVIALQDKTTEVITNVYGISASVTVVDNGTDCELFSYNQNYRIETRKKLKIATNEQVILYTGKVIPEKGVDILVKAFAVLIKKHPGLHCVIVGNGNPEYLQTLQRSIAKKQHLHFVPVQPQQELPKFYAAADIAVWPLQESLAMNDAAACNLPFIANNELGARKRISNNNALLYKKGDVQDLANKIEYLLLHPQERKAMGKRGRALMVAELSWDKIAEQYIV